MRRAVKDRDELRRKNESTLKRIHILSVTEKEIDTTFPVMYLSSKSTLLYAYKNFETLRMKQMITLVTEN